SLRFSTVISAESKSSLRSRSDPLPSPTSAFAASRSPIRLRNLVDLSYVSSDPNGLVFFHDVLFLFVFKEEISDSPYHRVVAIRGLLTLSRYPSAKLILKLRIRAP